MINKNKIQKIFLIVCLLFALSSLNGCGGTDNKSGTSASGEKHLIFAQTQTYSSLDPANYYDGWMVERCGVGETLTKFDDTMTAEGWLCKNNFSVSEDERTWTFSLRKNVNFSNGKPLTAQDAADSLNRVFKESLRAIDFFEPSSITAEGQTLSITTKAPCPTLPGMLADPLFVIIDTSVDLANIKETGPICTGPFVYDSFDPTTREITVKKNKNYWAGEVALDTVTYKQFSDTATMNLALLGGEVDVAYGISPSDVSYYEENSNYSVKKCAGARTDWGFLNQKGLLKDKALRTALLCCLDMDTICSVQLNGMYQKGNTPFPSENYGVKELKNPYSFDMEKAAAILKEAGYTDSNEDGILETPEGTPVELKLYTYTTRAELPTISEALQAAAAKLGILIHIQIVDDLWASVIPGGDYDIAVLNCSGISTGDPEAFLKQFFMTGGIYNQYGYSNRQLDSLIQTLSATLDQTKRENLVKQISQILMDDACCAFYSYPMMSIISKNNITGLECTMADYYWMNNAVAIP